jgi:hypothetical protein
VKAKRNDIKTRGVIEVVALPRHTPWTTATSISSTAT